MELSPFPLPLLNSLIILSRDMPHASFCSQVTLNSILALVPATPVVHGSCRCAVRSNRGIYCEACYFWYHTRVNMSNDEYTRLSHSDEGWCCPKCFKEVLPSFDSTDLSLAEDLQDTSERDSISLPPPPSPHNCLRPSSSLSILYANCRSLPSNLDSLRALAASQAPDIIAIVETWTDDSLSNFEIFIPDYYMVRRDRNRHGGGVLLYIKDNITTTKVINHASIEFLFVEITLRQCPLSFGLFYCPPLLS